MLVAGTEDGSSGSGGGDRVCMYVKVEATRSPCWSCPHHASEKRPQLPQQGTGPEDTALKTFSTPGRSIYERRQCTARGLQGPGQLRARLDAQPKSRVGAWMDVCEQGWAAPMPGSRFPFKPGSINRAPAKGWTPPWGQSWLRN